MNKLSNQIIAFFVVIGIVVAALYFSGVFNASTESSTDSEPSERTARTVEILVYSDYSCPSCKMYNPLTLQIDQEYGDLVNVVHRHFPLDSFPNSRLAHQAAEAARQQDKFYDMHNALYDLQAEWAPGHVNAREYFIRFAEEIGLDMDQFLTDLDSEETQNTVETQRQEGIRRTVNATPTFFIDGHKLRQNPQSYEQYKSIVELYMYRN